MNAEQNTSQDTTYNGWTNYETWAVGMFLDGNYDGEGTYLAVLELAREARSESTQRFQGRPNVTTSLLADALAGFVEEYVIDTAQESLGASLASDLLRAAFDEVDWRELAENKLTELDES